MKVEPDLRRVTVHCPGRCRELFHELREQSREHIVEDIHLEPRTGRDIIHLRTDDLEAIREVLRAHAPNATFVHILDE